MKKWLLVLLILLVPCLAVAAEPPIPADPALVSVLLPEYELAEGIINDDGDELRLLMRRPDGMLVFVGGVHSAEEGWQMTESTPLPEDTFLGVENFVESLGIGGRYNTVSLKPYADGRWGLSLIYPENEGLFRVGANWIFEEAGAPLLVGDHPWDDITQMDWSSLPANYEEALLQVDHSHWALVNNPNPQDRLNLRVKPDQKSTTLGKYYNGAPVHILENQGEWARVEILGVEGWMMTRYLAIGDAMKDVAFAGPQLMTIEGGAMLHAEPAEDAALSMVEGSFSSMQIIGIVNEEWYHVWFYNDNCGGYFHASDLWEGNG